MRKYNYWNAQSKKNRAETNDKIKYLKNLKKKNILSSSPATKPPKIPQLEQPCPDTLVAFGGFYN